jgi:hypothetical protein
MVPAAKFGVLTSIATPSGCRQASSCTIELGHGITISGRLVAGLVSSAKLRARRQWGTECDGKTRLRAWCVQQLYRYSWRQGIEQCVASSRRLRSLAVSDGSRKNLRPTKAATEAGVSASWPFPTDHVKIFVPRKHQAMQAFRLPWVFGTP